jgi:hypothetical protein
VVYFERQPENRPIKNFFRTLSSLSKRELPAGGQRRSDQGEEDHQDHQSKREEQPDRICADQTRLGGSLFPRKHRGTIFAEIQRTCFTSGLGALSWRKSPMTLLTNCTLPANLRTTDFTKSNDRLRVHVLTMFQRLGANARRDVSAYRRIGVSACRRVGVWLCNLADQIPISPFWVCCRYSLERADLTARILS